MATVKKKDKKDKTTEGFNALMYQLLETELGGVEIYKMALECVQNEELREEWTKYLADTQEHVQVATDLLEKLGLDPEADVPARQPVRIIGESLIQAMTEALENGTPAEAELAACEAVVLAETKDHMNWELVGVLAKKLKGEHAKHLAEAHAQVEEDEDHHLYHTMGWARELWIQALGLPAVLPPPEEEKDVNTAIGAARAKASRDQML